MNIQKYLLLAFVIHPTYAVSATIYLDESAYTAALSAGGYGTLHEGFENNVVWANSRASPTPSVISQGITWTSNQSTNEVRTGTLGGSVVDGTYGFFSLPHGDDTDSGSYCDNAEDPIPSECWLNDGWIITAPDGETLYGFGGWFDDAGGAKITFLLDGVDVNGNDTDNIDNWNRDGDGINGWTFVGVIDTNGFTSAEILELSGKDYQQKFIFGDKFSIGTTVPALPADFDGDGDVDGKDFLMWQRGEMSNPPNAEDLALWEAHFGTASALSSSTSVPEPSSIVLLLTTLACGLPWRRLT